MSTFRPVNLFFDAFYPASTLPVFADTSFHTAPPQYSAFSSTACPKLYSNPFTNHSGSLCKPSVRRKLFGGSAKELWEEGIKDLLPLSANLAELHLQKVVSSRPFEAALTGAFLTNSEKNNAHPFRKMASEKDSNSSTHVPRRQNATTGGVTIDKLIEAVLHNSPEVRKQAVDILGPKLRFMKNGDRMRACSALLKTLKDPNSPEIRALSAAWLGEATQHIYKPESLKSIADHLVCALPDRQWRVRMNVTIALGTTIERPLENKSSYLLEIARMINDEEIQVRNVAEAQFRSGLRLLKEDDNLSINKLVKLTQEFDNHARRIIMDILSEIIRSEMSGR